MLELVVRNMKDKRSVRRVVCAITGVDRASHYEVGPGWVRVASARPAAQFLAAIAAAGFNAVVWWDGR